MAQYASLWVPWSGRRGGEAYSPAVAFCQSYGVCLRNPAELGVPGKFFWEKDDILVNVRAVTLEGIGFGLKCEESSSALNRLT